MFARPGLRACAGALLALPGPALHDMDETSATLIVREAGHVQLRLQVPFEEVLRRSAAPRATPEAFRRTAAAMPPAEFERMLAGVEAMIVRQTFLLVNGRRVPLARWSRPDAEQVQARIRDAMMAGLVDPSAHTHSGRAEMNAEARSAGPVTTVQIRLPAALGPYLVTAYRPRERWVPAGALSPEMKISEGPSP